MIICVAFVKKKQLFTYCGIVKRCKNVWTILAFGVKELGSLSPSSREMNTTLLFNNFFIHR